MIADGATFASSGHTNAGREEEREMKGFMKGMALGAVAGMAAEMALQTAVGKRTKMGKAAQTVTDAMDSAATAVKHTMGK